MEQNVETYNLQASASKEALEDFYTCVLDVFDETQTTFL